MGNALCCVASCVVEEFWGSPRGAAPLVPASSLAAEKPTAAAPARRLAPVEPEDTDDGVRAPPPPPVAIGAPIKDKDYYCGVNCYYLMMRAASEGTREMAEETLDQIARLGFSVIRIWAFNDGAGWNALQTKPGVYDQNVFKGLDWVVAESAKRGLRLMMTLTNFWEDYGGFPQYVRWSRRLAADAPAKGEEFYDDPVCQRMYRTFIKDVVTRVNTITGVAYRDDPTIFAWDIVNEARCEGDTTYRKLTKWLDVTAAYVKTLDKKHPVTAGLEGFFGPSTPQLLDCNPYNQTHGVDWVANCNTPNLDFVSIHLYADQWCPDSSDDAERCDWAVRWLKGHIQGAKMLRKPLCLQEFGKKPAGPGRAKLFKQLLAIAESEAESKGTLAGSLVWMYAHEDYPDYDNYTIYERGAPTRAAVKQVSQPLVKDAESTKLVVDFARALRPLPPADGAALKPADGAAAKPAAGAAGKPAAGAAVKPAAGAAVKPAESAAAKPAAGAAVKPAAGAAVKPAESAAVKPAAGAALKPAESAAAKPAAGAAVKPAAGAAVKPAAGAAVKPARS
ncbi:mannan endo-1,4-beta-mannosidase-like [Raphidocelis subcapitata]|uniref:mannan endo-1,4-beta-mannosidase n=1 Tax=Raphidocelis subcapitata TaxID=307507 RepID=A0A2V0PCF1_9CHLO|nr:mannan endo-1,4-beta-mannosidase-like [Raphidocelis subcapitata]|eukprot:GBF97528.1 mannan endo-1,4-beta-mannosidase-like [Raphidocelis subcapitata]